MLFRRRANADEQSIDAVGDLAVIIPALNEESNIGRAIKSALAKDDGPSASRSKTVVVVVDGGSSDGTVPAARRAGASLVLRCRTRGRGAQLAEGVAAVGLDSRRSSRRSPLSSPSTSSSFFLPPRRTKKPDTVLFLHADSRLPPRYRRSIEEALRGRGGERKKRLSSWGSFETVYPEGGEPVLSPLVGGFLSACVRLRTRVFGLPYGDQAIFVRSKLLEEVGGVRPLPLMEDVDLVDRLSRAGKNPSPSLDDDRVINSRPAIARGAVSTSGRRWAEKGLVRATASNLWTLARWRLGLSSEDELAREYYG